MPVKVQLVLREAKAKAAGKPGAAKAGVAPLKVREDGDAALGARPKPRSVGAFLCDRKEPQGRP